ncbi:unnamed protein product [Clonostachys solani]|uniref:Uncharacterized protein n=1 Tax=Clonostachys solani TaxID=160281 RepID=A0A9N9VZE2_9HYPO|nr:unnamed protein product [Clonostachys solani]
MTKFFHTPKTLGRLPTACLLLYLTCLRSQHHGAPSHPSPCLEDQLLADLGLPHPDLGDSPELQPVHLLPAAVLENEPVRGVRRRRPLLRLSAAVLVGRDSDDLPAARAFPLLNRLELLDLLPAAETQILNIEDLDMGVALE